MTDPHKTSIAARLAMLYKKHGRLTADLVVEDAKSPKSPLHDEFEWDDTLAAAKYREDQARVLIRSVQVVVTVDTVTVKSVAYVRDPHAKANEQGYISVESLREDTVSAREALQYECGHASALLGRARHLALALGLSAEVDMLLAGLEQIRKQVAA